MRHGLTSVILVCLVLAAVVARTQEQTASIVGVVRDSSGSVVPGASVTAVSAGGLTVRCTADDAGRYRFPALPPGVFDVTAELTGLAPAKVESVQLRLGQRLDIPITLDRAAWSETVRVVAESRRLAVTQSAGATSLRAEEIEKLPTGRDFTDVVGQVAGANPEPDPAFGIPPSFMSIDGSSGAENRFIVDGAESTDLVFGVSARPVATDFLDEIQVKSSGYAPEFGGSTGGVINAITKSGSNAWHGDAILYWEADELDAGNAPTLQLNPNDSRRAEHVTFPKDDYHALETGFTLGGPIVRDKLWFFAGYLPRFEPIRRTAPFSDRTTGTLRQYLKSHNAAASVTGQLGPRWRFRTSYNLGHVEREGLLQQPNGTSAADAAYDESRIQPGWSLSASVDWLPGPSVYTSLRVAYSMSDEYTADVYEGDLLRWLTSSVGLPGVPPAYQQPANYQNVPSNQGWNAERMGRLGIQADSSFFFDAAGRHQLKAGVQLDRRTFDILLGNLGNVHLLFWDQPFAGQRGPFGYYQVISNPVLPDRGFTVLGDAATTNLGLFAQDAWTIGDRLTLNIGLRTENEHVPSFSREASIPETAITFAFADKLAPRLGFAWDATGDGRTRVYGSWGIFYDIMKLGVSANYGAQFQSFYWYTLDDADLGQIQDNPRCPPECPGRLIRHLDFLTGSPINDPDNPAIQIAPGLEPMKLQEAALGVEREIVRNLSLSARYIHKQLDRAVESVGFLNEQGAQSYAIANPGFGAFASFVPRGAAAALPYPRARRDYDAVEIGLERRMANGWGGRCVYRWSRLQGNYSGLASSDFSQVAPNVTWAFDSPMMSFDENARPVYGLLATDRTHQVKAQLVYDFATGTTVGASWFGSSGDPKSRWAQFTPGQNFRVFYQGRETDGRMPYASRLDLQLQQRIQLSERMRLTLAATASNLFNQGAATDVWPQELFPGQAITIAEKDFFAGFDTQRLIEEQRLARDPRFIMDRQFQAPRSIRLAARLSF